MQTILIILVVVVVGAVVFIASRPADFRYERTATIPGSPDVVFRQVNNLQNFQKWSPWAAKDPNMNMTFSGPEEGIGASQQWAGNKDVGEGKMTVQESNPNDLIRMKLEFIKPFAATHTAEFTFKPDGDGTSVTWAIIGTNKFVEKAFGVFMDMDKMIGQDFEAGLAKMKEVVQAG